MIHRDCRYYRGHKPCRFNKLDGSECPTCTHFSRYGSRVLIIKLDALGDVLRTASLVPIIAQRHNAPYICWLTRPEAIELVNMIDGVDEVIPLNVDSMARLATGNWDRVYSLSNDHVTASLATLAAAKIPPVGFSIRDGGLRPSNEAAAKWLEMAAFDRLKRANTETYQKIMLDIIGAPARFAPPRLNIDKGVLRRARERIDGLFPGSSKRRVAINVGSGARWPKKMLGERQIADYVGAVRAALDVDVLLVGGQAEADKAAKIVALCGAGMVREALTAESLPDFVGVLSQTDVLLCGDTLALHIATALELPTVCVVGPTSAPELADFDGLVAKTTASELDCLGCYGDCAKTDNCMSLLRIGDLVKLTERQLARSARPGGTHRYLSSLTRNLVT